MVDYIKVPNKELTLVFENCEEVKFIGHWDATFGGIEKTHSTHLGSYRKAKSATFEVSEKAKWEWRGADKPSDIFEVFYEVIKRKDITHIWADGEEYAVDWAEGSDYENAYQDGRVVARFSSAYPKEGLTPTLYLQCEIARFREKHGIIEE